MLHQIEFKNTTAKEEFRKLSEELIAKVDKRLKALPPETVFLRVVIEEIAGETVWRVSITLDVPGKVLAAREENFDGNAAIRAAFAEIERQIEAYKSSMRGEQWWKRLARRKELRQMKAGVSGEAKEKEDGGAFFSIVSPHIDALSHFVSHLVAYAEARGDLVRGEVTPQDIVDETLLRAYERFYRKAPEGSIRRWLNRIALKEVDAEVRRSKAERSRIYIEDRIPITPPELEVSYLGLGDEVLDFYQFDESLKVEDILADFELPPADAEVEASELRARVRAALESLPIELRRVLLFRYVLGLDGQELAK
ncbi:MAG: putative polymerase, sigma 28 subunit, partial [Candidatus Solibacter sp.]|nr:putative polymerase, sigma 28 subunit [Candidatus Solibacter sp.]